MFKLIRNAIFGLIPIKYHLPSFYYYYMVTHKLEPELKSLSKYISGCRTAVDVGANRGLYTYALSSLCEEVISFEPQPWCFEKISAFNKTNVVAHNVGLSDRSGLLDLYIPRDNNGGYADGLASFREMSDSSALRVPVKMLDEYSLEDVDFIKIDVEGHEFEVLDGAKDTIMRNRPILLIEIEQRHLLRPIDEVFNMVIHLGYDGFYLMDGGLRSVREFSVEEQQLKYLTNVLDKRYINNFFFFPKM